MLRTMIKHEWKATWRMLGLLNITLIILSIIGRIGMAMQSIIPSFLANLYMTLYVLLLLASIFGTVILLVVRFYRNLYTDEGYLTNTLPVTTTCKLNGKLFNGFFWIWINGISILLSVIIMTFGSINFGTFFEGIQYIVTSITTFWHFPSEICTIALIILFLLLLSLNVLLTFYFCISIGCLFHSHKVLASVVALLVNYIVLQIICSFTLFTSGFVSQMTGLSITSTSGIELLEPLMIVYRNLLLQNFLIDVVFCVVYYLVSHYLLSRKLNLN